MQNNNNNNNNNNKQTKKQTKTKKGEWSQLDFFWINFGFKFDKAVQVTTVSSIWCSIVAGITTFSIQRNLILLMNL